MHLGRGEVIETLVRALVIVEMEVAEQSEVEFQYGRVGLEVDIFVFDGSPKSFDENVIQGSASTVHADADVLLFQTAGELTVK